MLLSSSQLVLCCLQIGEHRSVETNSSKPVVSQTVVHSGSLTSICAAGQKLIQLLGCEAGIEKRTEGDQASQWILSLSGII